MFSKTREPEKTALPFSQTDKMLRPVNGVQLVMANVPQAGIKAVRRSFSAEARTAVMLLLSTTAKLTGKTAPRPYCVHPDSSVPPKISIELESFI